MSKPGDERLGDLIRTLNIEDVSDEELLEIEATKKAKIAIIGVPCDEGVKRNKGRPGAKEGPSIFRKILTRTGTLQNPEFDVDLTQSLLIYDLGDVPVPTNFDSNSCQETDLLSAFHDAIKVLVRWALDHKMVPFVVGGGNDQSYPVAKAVLDYVKANKPTLGGKDFVGVVNIDAHLDVRPLLDSSPDSEGNTIKLRHSGCPFNLLLNDQDFQGPMNDEKPADRNQFVEYAAQGSQCSAEHANFVKERGGRIVWLNELRGGIAPMSLALSRFRSVLDSFGLKVNALVSFDIDSIRSADCPGVSCPSAVGLTAEEALSICWESGSRDIVVAFDTSEFNPLIEADRTGRLLTAMFYNFCLGVARRQSARRF